MKGRLRFKSARMVVNVKRELRECRIRNDELKSTWKTTRRLPDDRHVAAAVSGDA